MKLRAFPFTLLALRPAAAAIGMAVIGAAAQAAESAVVVSRAVLSRRAGRRAAESDPYAVDNAQLVAQFAWMKDNGYRVVSLDDVIAAREGRRRCRRKRWC